MKLHQRANGYALAAHLVLAWLLDVVADPLHAAREEAQPAGQDQARVAHVGIHEHDPAHAVGPSRRQLEREACAHRQADDRDGLARSQGLEPGVCRRGPCVDGGRGQVVPVGGAVTGEQRPRHGDATGREELAEGT